MVVIQYLRVPLLEFPGLGMMKPWVLEVTVIFSKKKSAGCFFSEGCLGLLKTVRIGNFRSFTAKRCLQKMTFGFQKEGSHRRNLFHLFSGVNSLWNLVIGFLRGVVIPLIFPKVPQSALGILRVPQLHPPFEHPPPLRILQLWLCIFWLVHLLEERFPKRRQWGSDWDLHYVGKCAPKHPKLNTA